MPALQNNGGDVLARGGVRATFRPMGENVSREEWEKMFKGKPAPEKKARYLFECPFHGLFESEREFFISGGYPLMNEHAKGKCPQKECGEESKYGGYIAILSRDASDQTGATSSKSRVARKRLQST